MNQRVTEAKTHFPDDGKGERERERVKEKSEYVLKEKGRNEKRDERNRGVCLW